jgi:predicted  nucleic acid-binding Zn-ribbon protein
MPLKCLRCGEPLEPEMAKCPKCGSGDRLVTVEDSIHALDMVGVKQKAEGYRRFKRYSRSVEKVSKHGKIARETLIIDKETKRKYHLVEEQNEQGEWIVVHKEDEPFESINERPKEKYEKGKT